MPVCSRVNLNRVNGTFDPGTPAQTLNLVADTGSNNVPDSGLTLGMF